MVSVWRTNAGPGPYILLDVVTSDGHIVTQQQNPAVTKELFSEIWSWKMERATDTGYYISSPTANGTNRIFVSPGNLVVVVNYCSTYYNSHK